MSNQERRNCPIGPTNSHVADNGQVSHKLEHNQSETPATLLFKSPTIKLPAQQVCSRSKKRKSNLQPVSFESKFMDQHSQALSNIIKNYLELSLHEVPEQIVSFGSLTSLEPATLQTPRDIGCWVGLNYLLSAGSKKQFAKDLISEQKLSQFLLDIAERYPLKVAVELTQICYLAWQNYTRVNRHDNQQQQWIKSAEFYAEASTHQLFYHPLIQCVNLRKCPQNISRSQQQIYKNFQQFLKGIFVTVFLVVEEFFDNPHAEFLPHHRPSTLSTSTDQESDSNGFDNFNPYKRKQH